MQLQSSGILNQQRLLLTQWFCNQQASLVETHSQTSQPKELDMKEAKLGFLSAMQPVTAIPVYPLYFRCHQFQKLPQYVTLEIFVQ